jgi:hypothetical protein
VIHGDLDLKSQPTGTVEEEKKRNLVKKKKVQLRKHIFKMYRMMGNGEDRGIRIAE